MSAGAALRVRERLARSGPRALARLKSLVFMLALGPLARLIAGAITGNLGVNPAETVQRSTGTWTLVFLLVTLAITPLRRLSGWNWLLRLRRLLGLYAFFYASLHFLSYLWLDQFFDLVAMAKDVMKRPFIMIGMSAFLLLIPLAATSTAAMVRRLGARRWTLLHRLVYPAAVCAVIHYGWLVKRDVTQPAIYAGILVALFALRAGVGRRISAAPPGASGGATDSTPRRFRPASTRREPPPA